MDDETLTNSTVSEHSTLVFCSGSTSFTLPVFITSLLSKFWLGKFVQFLLSINCLHFASSDMWRIHKLSGIQVCMAENLLAGTDGKKLFLHNKCYQINSN